MEKDCIADLRILSWWAETDLRTDSLHQSDALLGLTWCFWLLIVLLTKTGSATFASASWTAPWANETVILQRKLMHRGPVTVRSTIHVPIQPGNQHQLLFFSALLASDGRKSQDLEWAACSVPRKSDQAATNSEFCWMQGPGTECGLSIGFDPLLLSF